MELRERVCPICGTGISGHERFPARLDDAKLGAFAFSSRKLPEYLHYRLLRCHTCDVLYANPAPSAEALGTEYEQAAYDSTVEATFAAETYAHYLREHILPGLPQRRGALDIGTGNGAFLSALFKEGFTNVQGVEPSSAPIAAAPPDVRPLIRKGMFRAGDFAQGSFSLISCFQTIEHVHDPLGLMRDILGLLRPGGVAYLVGHDSRSLQAKLLGERSPILDIEHLQLFSAKSLRNLLAKAGFERLSVFPIANRYPLSYWLRLVPLPARPKLGLGGVLRALHLDGAPLPLRAGNLAIVGSKP